MEQVKQLVNFYAAIKHDPRIGTTHISLYMALFHFYNLNEFQNPIEITRASVMEVAKISGFATYHRCIKDLHQFGYIFYTPSYNPSISSRVHLVRIWCRAARYRSCKRRNIITQISASVSKQTWQELLNTYIIVKPCPGLDSPNPRNQLFIDEVCQNCVVKNERASMCGSSIHFFSVSTCQYKYKNLVGIKVLSICWTDKTGFLIMKEFAVQMELFVCLTFK